METRDYRSLSLPQPLHDRWLARVLDISDADCDMSLAQLKKAGFITWKKHHWFKNFSALNQVGTRSMEEQRRDAHYWFSRLQKRFSKPDGPVKIANSAIAYKTVAVSDAKARRLNELVRVFWNDMTTLLLEEDSSPNNHSYLLALQLVDLIELAKDYCPEL